ncbi:MAG: hypothetical protein NVSMB64_18710 [Candidatus Velthaea sp.]
MVIRVAVGLALLLVLGLPARGVADDVPDIATLRAQIDAAYGAAPPVYHQLVRFSNASSTGKRETFVRGKDRREVLDTGVLHSESGTFQGERWHQNDNGHTVIEYPDRSPADVEPTTTTVTRVSEPIDAFVVAVLTKAGNGRRDFIDPQTSFLIRCEIVAPNGKSVTTYSGYKAFGQQHRATHWVERDDRTALTTTSDLVEYAATDPGEASIAISENRRPMLEFPDHVPQVRLPATLGKRGHWIVRVTIGGRGLDFLLDTGASGIMIDSGVAQQLNMPVFNKGRNSANAGSYETGNVIVPEMQVGELTMRNAVVLVGPASFNESTTVKTVGLLGFDFLCEAGFTLDYEHGLITARKYGTYPPPEDPWAVALDIRLNTQTPYVLATVNGIGADRMIFDTGAAVSLLLLDSFMRRHPEALPDSDLLGPREVDMVGVGGHFATRRYTLKHLRIGKLDFRDFPILRTLSAASFSTHDGLLGPGFFRLFTVDLDYPDGKIYLTPNAAGTNATIKK